MPTAWRLWVKILPLKGVKASWEDWETTKTGVKIARKHKALFLSIKITELATANSLAELLTGDDPFGEILQ